MSEQLFEFEVTYPDVYSSYPYDFRDTEVARNASAARYKFFWRHLSETRQYSDVFRCLKSRKIGPASPRSFFPKNEYQISTWEAVRTRRGIHFAFLGQRIDVDGKMGTIVGGNDSLNLNVVFDGQGHVENCHPTWETTYYKNDGHTVEKCYKEK